MKCVNCGSELKEGAKFCNKCGTSQVLKPEPPQEAKPAPPQEVKPAPAVKAQQDAAKKNTILPLAIGGICAVIAIALLAFFLTRPKDVAPPDGQAAIANSDNIQSKENEAPPANTDETPRKTNTGAALNYESAVDKLRSLLQDVDILSVEAQMIPIAGIANDLSDELPELSDGLKRVESAAAAAITIFSSTEKAEPGNDNWFALVAEEFNRSGFKTASGADMGVTVYSISSGMATDYIISGKYRPNAFTPSNELWGDMIKSAGVDIELKAKRIAGNTAGILMEKGKYGEFISKYGEINGRTITQAVEAKDIEIGYTNPYASSTALNFLLSVLHIYDAENPLSETAKNGFKTFQTNVAVNVDTTLELRRFEGLQAMIFEYQQYKNTPALSGYEFTPLGARHDSPVYAIGTLSADKTETLDKFIEFCLMDTYQELAQEKGFNYLDDYTPQFADFDADILAPSQKLWKEHKNAGGPVAAVFVADTSDIMSGEPMNRLKEALKNATNYIGRDNYVGLLSYNDTIYSNLPTAQFSYNQQALFLGAIETLTVGGGAAPYSAVLAALDELAALKEQDPQIRPMIFLLSADSQNKGYTLDEVREVVIGMGIPVHTIEYNVSLDELKEISELSAASNRSTDTLYIKHTLKELFKAQL